MLNSHFNHLFKLRQRHKKAAILAFFTYSIPCLSFFNTILLLRLGGLEYFGQYVLLSTILSQMVIIANFGLPSYLSELFAKNPSARLQAAYGSISAIIYFVLTLCLASLFYLFNFSVANALLFSTLLISNLISNFAINEPYIRFKYGMLFSSKIGLLKVFIFTILLLLSSLLKPHLSPNTLVSTSTALSPVLLLLGLSKIQKSINKSNLVVNLNLNTVKLGFKLIKKRGIFSFKIVLSRLSRDSISNFDIYIISALFPSALGSIALLKKVFKSLVDPVGKVLLNYIQKHTWSNRKTFYQTFDKIQQLSIAIIVIAGVIACLFNTVKNINLEYYNLRFIENLKGIGDATLMIFCVNVFLFLLLELSSPLSRTILGINETLVSWLAASLINISLSLLLANILGVNGVILGTTISVISLILLRQLRLRHKIAII